MFAKIYTCRKLLYCNRVHIIFADIIKNSLDIFSCIIFESSIIINLFKEFCEKYIEKFIELRFDSKLIEIPFLIISINYWKIYITNLAIRWVVTLYYIRHRELSFIKRCKISNRASVFWIICKHTHIKHHSKHMCFITIILLKRMKNTRRNNSNIIFLCNICFKVNVKFNISAFNIYYLYLLVPVHRKGVKVFRHSCPINIKRKEKISVLNCLL